jgi:hypothetical protein
MATRKPRAPAWQPPDYTVQQVRAVQAVARGDASSREQQLAMDWIVQQAAGTYELSFRSDGDGGDRETTMAEGRRFVGLQIVKLVNMNGKLIAELEKREGKTNG